MPPRTSADVITQIRTMMTRVTDPEIVRQLQNLLDALNSSSIEAETAALAMEGLIRVYNDATDATRTLELGTERLIKTLLGVEQRTDGLFAGFTRMVAGTEGLDGALKAMGASISKTLTPLNIGISTVKKFTQGTVLLTMQVDAAATAFAKATGTGNQYKDIIRKVEFENRRFGVSATEAASANQALLGGFSNFLIIGDDAQKVLAGNVAQFEKLGISAGTTTKFLQSVTRTTGRTWKQALQLQKTVMGVASAFGDDLNKVLEEAAEVMSQLAVHGVEKLTGVLNNLYAASKRTGMGMSEIIAFSDRFDTFEAAADAAGRLNAVLGQMGAAPIIDTMQILEETDPAKRMQLFANSIKQSGIEFETLGKYQQDTIANAMGLSTAEMRRIILQEGQTTKLDAAMQNAGLSQKKINKLMEEGRDLMTEMNILIMQFATNLQKPLGMVKDFVGMINNVMGSMGAFGKFFTGAASMLVGVGVPALLLSKLLLRGSRAMPMYVRMTGGGLRPLLARMGFGSDAFRRSQLLGGAAGPLQAGTSPRLVGVTKGLGIVGMALGGVALGLAAFNKFQKEKDSEKKKRRGIGSGIGAALGGIGLFLAAGALGATGVGIPAAAALLGAGLGAYGGGELGARSVGGAQKGAFTNLSGNIAPSVVKNPTTLPIGPQSKINVGEKQTAEAIIPLNEEGRRGIGIARTNKLLVEQNTKLDELITALSKQQIVLIKSELEKAGFMNRFAKVTGPWG